MKLTVRALVVPLLCLVACADPPPDAGEPTALPRRALAQAAGVTSAAELTKPLTPDGVALLTLARSPRLRALRARRGLADAELVAAGLLPNPRLALQVGAPVGGQDAKDVSVGGELSWEVTALLGRDAAERSARLERAAVDLRLAWTEWVTAQAARLHAIQVVYLTRRLELARRIARTWAARLAADEKAFAARAITALRVGAARDARRRAQLAALALERQLVAARARLATDLGVRDGGAVALDPSWRPTAARPRLAVLLERLPGRLDLLAREREQRARAAGVERELDRRYPPVELGVFAQREPDRVASVGLSLALDLPFRSRDPAAALRATASAEQADREHDAALAAARAEVTRLLQALRVADRQRTAAAAAARDAVALGALAARAARSGALDLLAATDARLGADRARLRQLALEQAQAELVAALLATAGP